MIADSFLPALKAAILAETDPEFAAHRDAGSTGLMAEWYKLPSTFVVWRTTTPTSEIANAITWANCTPADPPDDTTTYTNRALACQGKQLNLQNLWLAAQGSLASSLSNVRQGMNDSLTNIPAGLGGALLSAGWSAVRLAMQRYASRGEKIFATGTGTTGSPGSLVFEGELTDYDMIRALSV